MKDESKAPNPKGIFFNSALVTDPEYDYVCWLDVMGTSNQMLRSLPIAANFIYKLQCAVLEAAEEVGFSQGVRLYPVMDGVYITSQRRESLQAILNQTLCRVAITFLKEQTPFHQFLVRGAIAFGPVYHGCDLDPKTSFIIQTCGNPRQYADGLAYGASVPGRKRSAPFWHRSALLRTNFRTRRR